MADAKYSFLRGLVANVPDVHTVATATTDDDKQQQQQQRTSAQRDDVTGPARPRGRSVCHHHTHTSLGIAILNWLSQSLDSQLRIL